MCVCVRVSVRGHVGLCLCFGVCRECASSSALTRICARKTVARLQPNCGSCLLSPNTLARSQQNAMNKGGTWKLTHCQKHLRSHPPYHSRQQRSLPRQLCAISELPQARRSSPEPSPQQSGKPAKCAIACHYLGVAFEFWNRETVTCMF